MKKLFHCPSCGRDKPIDQLGKIVKGSNSKRCKTCCANANKQRLLLTRGPGE